MSNDDDWRKQHIITYPVSSRVYRVFICDVAAASVPTANEMQYDSYAPNPRRSPKEELNKRTYR